MGSRIIIDGSTYAFDIIQSSMSSEYNLHALVLVVLGSQGFAYLDLLGQLMVLPWDPSWPLFPAIEEVKLIDSEEFCRNM